MTRTMINLQIGLFSLLLLVSSITRGHAASSESLIDAAKREGEVVYYASMNLSEANAIVAEFEKRYPFIKVKLQRTGSEKLLSRVLTEFRAKKIFADVIQTVAFSMHIFNRTGALARYLPIRRSSRKKDFGLRFITMLMSPLITLGWCRPVSCQKPTTTCSIPSGKASS